MYLTAFTSIFSYFQFPLRIFFSAFFLCVSNVNVTGPTYVSACIYCVYLANTGSGRYYLSPGSAQPTTVYRNVIVIKDRPSPLPPPNMAPPGNFIPISGRMFHMDVRRDIKNIGNVQIFEPAIFKLSLEWKFENRACIKYKKEAVTNSSKFGILFYL